MRLLYNYGCKLSPDQALVQDTVQELFVDLWKSRSRLTVPVSVKFYLFRSLRRRILKNLREGNRFPLESFSSDSAVFAAQDAESTFIEQETGEHRLSHLQKALRQLPVRQQEVIKLRFYDELSLSEIAAILDINEQSVRNLLQRAIVHLRQTSLATLLPLLVLSALNFFWFK